MTCWTTGAAWGSPQSACTSGFGVPDDRLGAARVDRAGAAAVGCHGAWSWRGLSRRMGRRLDVLSYHALLLVLTIGTYTNLSPLVSVGPLLLLCGFLALGFGPLRLGANGRDRPGSSWRW